LSAALANRLFEALGDPVALRVVRELQHEPLTQAELVRRVGAAQSAVSRAAAMLKTLGLTDAPSQRGKITLRAPASVGQLLTAANGLAMDLLAIEARDQAALSAESSDWSPPTEGVTPKDLRT
jgi:DNA-binding transcriptional ArsR family regulator